MLCIIMFGMIFISCKVESGPVGTTSTCVDLLANATAAAEACEGIEPNNLQCTGGTLADCKAYVTAYSAYQESMMCNTNWSMVDEDAMNAMCETNHP